MGKSTNAGKCFQLGLKRKRAYESEFDDESVNQNSRIKRRRFTVSEISDKSQELSMSVPLTYQAGPSRKRPASAEETSEPGASKKVCKTTIAIQPTRLLRSMGSSEFDKDVFHHKKVDSQSRPAPTNESPNQTAAIPTASSR
ncbi:hypothetical protein OUZ56_030010 [Daphnia magna]|uniref:Uncharacterized protein n=1 Tax=Daphnia magna TaxID=35525 RepID=A0ABR0B8G8_9CRUS|nr:hypothetical protein OUZ56_030010 [Daphnia magna]